MENKKKKKVDSARWGLLMILLSLGSIFLGILSRFIPAGAATGSSARGSTVVVTKVGYGAAMTAWSGVWRGLTISIMSYIAFAFTLVALAYLIVFVALACAKKEKGKIWDAFVGFLSIGFLSYLACYFAGALRDISKIPAKTWVFYLPAVILAFAAFVFSAIGVVPLLKKGKASVEEVPAEEKKEEKPVEEEKEEDEPIVEEKAEEEKAEEPIEEASEEEKSEEAAAEEPLEEEKAEEPVEEAKEETVEEPIEEPAEEVAEETVEEPAEETKAEEEPIEEEKVEEAPAEEKAEEEPAAEEKPVEKSAPIAEPEPVPSKKENPEFEAKKKESLEKLERLLSAVEGEEE